MTTTFTKVPGDSLKGIVRVIREVCTTGDEGTENLPVTEVVNGETVPSGGMNLGGLGQLDIRVATHDGSDLAQGGILRAHTFDLDTKSFARCPDMDLQVNDGFKAQHFNRVVNSRDWLVFLPSGFGAVALDITMSGSLRTGR